VRVSTYVCESLFVFVCLHTIPSHKLNNFHLVCTNLSKKSKLILKLRAFPKSWQWGIGGECVDLAVVSIQTKDNKIAGSKASPNNFRTPAVIESTLERGILSQNIRNYTVPFEKKPKIFFLKTVCFLQYKLHVFILK